MSNTHQGNPNKLIHESSPYLLQHAYNPVKWYPWGEEAFRIAVQENKPVLLSIGYATCHWCHVMEKESFEDEQTALLMNEFFINIKVDREERPDVDALYMEAVQMITGSGGWPLHVFLTPQKKPFYGGTYFPPQPLHNRPSWKDVIYTMHNYYVNKPEVVANQSAQLFQVLNANNATALRMPTNVIQYTSADRKHITNNILKSADTEWGGFGNAPKFPSTFCISYLLQSYTLDRNVEALNHALLSLNKMYEGGIYDHLLGGFARYSTDKYWFAPHFEKMLYDNALLLKVYAQAYSITNEKMYSDVVEECVNFLNTKMKSDEGGYFSAIDADSEGIEGKYYVWQLQEIHNVLGSDASLFCAYYGVTEPPNWELGNILSVRKQHKELCLQYAIDESNLTNKIKQMRSKLLLEREKRIAPIIDYKIILSWNALLVSAMVECGLLLHEQEYISHAIETLNYLLEQFKTTEGNYARIKTKDQLTHKATLEDLAYLIEACIAVYKATGEDKYIYAAHEILHIVEENFTEENAVLYNLSHKDNFDIIVNKKEIYDGALPSSNAVMCNNLHYLGHIFYNDKWLDRSKKMIQYMRQNILKSSSSYAYWSYIVHRTEIDPIVLNITGEDAVMSFLKNYNVASNEWVVALSKLESTLPCLAHKFSKNQNLFYVCYNKTCKPPFLKWVDLKNALDKPIGRE